MTNLVILAVLKLSPAHLLQCGRMNISSQFATHAWLKYKQLQGIQAHAKKILVYLGMKDQ